MLLLKAAGEQQRAEHAVAEPGGELFGGAQVPPGGRIAAVEPDDRDDGVRAAFDARLDGRVGLQVELGQGVVPPADVVQQFAEHRLCLRNAYRVAGVVGELLDLLRRADRVAVPAELAQRDRLVDVQQQPQVGQ